MPSTTTGFDRVYTTGSLARLFRVDRWQILSLYKRRLLPEAPRHGGYRLITEADLPAVRRALEQAGYIYSKADLPAIKRAIEEAKRILAGDQKGA